MTVQDQDPTDDGDVAPARSEATPAEAEAEVPDSSPNDEGDSGTDNDNKAPRPRIAPPSASRRQQGQNRKNNRQRQRQERMEKTKMKKEVDASLEDGNDIQESAPLDPRGEDRMRRRKGGGKNTESFDPESTLVRPDLRLLVASPTRASYGRPLTHDDVVVVPELFGPEDDWSNYRKLSEEIAELQKKQAKDSEWTSWHEGAHLIVKNPSGSETFRKVVDKLCQYFGIQKKTVYTRFNWYKDSSDWKPFHHDSAAFNARRAKTQNITVGVSFGACRELAFLRAQKPGTGTDAGDADDAPPPCRLYFPQPNNGVFSFGRDVNIRWKHAINALPEQEQDGKGRISIILWGALEDAIEEEGSPELLGADGQGPHAHAHSKRKFEKRNKNKANNNNRQRRPTGNAVEEETKVAENEAKVEQDKGGEKSMTVSGATAAENAASAKENGQGNGRNRKNNNNNRHNNRNNNNRQQRPVGGAEDGGAPTENAAQAESDQGEDEVTAVPDAATTETIASDGPAKENGQGKGRNRKNNNNGNNNNNNRNRNKRQKAMEKPHDGAENGQIASEAAPAATPEEKPNTSSDEKENQSNAKKENAPVEAEEAEEADQADKNAPNTDGQNRNRRNNKNGNRNNNQNKRGKNNNRGKKDQSQIQNPTGEQTDSAESKEGTTTDGPSPRKRNNNNNKRGKKKFARQSNENANPDDSQPTNGESKPEEATNGTKPTAESKLEANTNGAKPEKETNGNKSPVDGGQSVSTMNENKPPAEVIAVGTE